MPVKNFVARAGEISGEIVSWRRRLHKRPELGFQEHETAALVADALESLGIEVHRGVARTGVIGLLRAGNGRGPAVLLRADMDALPIEEVAGREYGSEIPGRMHACGHDGHMAILLGAATLLSGAAEELERDVVFCFQPAEEGQGGAREMIREGVLERFGIGEAFALHLWSQLPAGTMRVRPGAALAANDEFTARFVGKGGHGAMPQEARDPVLAASHAVVALQQVVSRNVDPMEPAVVTVGSFQAGSAHNIIPSRARILGTMRSFDESVRELLRERVREVLEGSARLTGCTLEFELLEGYPAMVNDAEATSRIREIGSEVLGEENVSEHPPIPASEDFSYFLRKVPGAMFLLGAGNEARGITAPHHAPDFDIDESVLPSGAAILAALALGG